MRIAIFPGTFDPFTKGHADIVARGLEIFDRIVVAIGVNDSKVPCQTVEERVAAISRWYDADDSLLYLIVNRHSFGSGIIVMSLKDIDNPKIAYVVRGYSDCIRCRDGLLFLSYDRELKSFMVNNIVELSSYAIPPSTQEVRL